MTDDTVSAIMEKWAFRFSAFDVKAIASLYSKNALFFGSNPTLYRGNDGVAAYFDGLPPWSSRTAQFTDVTAVQAGSEVISVAATATFLASELDSPLTVKLTWVIVREDGDWKIVNHHVSSQTPLI